MKEVFIVSAKRTPIGGFLGNLSGISATELGALVIREAYASANVDPKNICSVYMGNVLSSNLGQSPARQASKFAGLPDDTDCTTVNKVCAAGMKATILYIPAYCIGINFAIIIESRNFTPNPAIEASDKRKPYLSIVITFFSFR